MTLVVPVALISPRRASTLYYETEEGIIGYTAKQEFFLNLFVDLNEDIEKLVEKAKEMLTRETPPRPPSTRKCTSLLLPSSSRCSRVPYLVRVAVGRLHHEYNVDNWDR